MPIAGSRPLSVHLKHHALESSREDYHDRDIVETYSIKLRRLGDQRPSLLKKKLEDQGYISMTEQQASASMSEHP
jgi:hypothetical protein